MAPLRVSGRRPQARARPWAGVDQAPGSPSGLFKAGTILLLVGAILHAVGAVVLVGIAIVMLTVGRAGDGSQPFAVIGVVYLVLGVLLAVGTVFGFLAHSKAARGDAHAAWVQGLVASLLPPLQLVTLLGAIFCLVSREGELAKQAQARA